eukprot:gene11155-biopygen16839
MLQFLCAFGVTLSSPFLPAHVHSPAGSSGLGRCAWSGLPTAYPWGRLLEPVPHVKLCRADHAQASQCRVVNIGGGGQKDADDKDDKDGKDGKDSKDSKDSKDNDDKDDKDGKNSKDGKDDGDDNDDNDDGSVSSNHQE